MEKSTVLAVEISLSLYTRGLKKTFNLRTIYVTNHILATRLAVQISGQIISKVNHVVTIVLYSYLYIDIIVDSNIK